MTTPATGYFRTGDDWLHRRNPLTKLLGLLAVLLAAFLLPPPTLVVLGLGCAVVASTIGLVGPLLRSLRVPAVLVASILVINALFFPGATDIIARIGPIALSREGLAFGIVSAGRILVAFAASLLLLYTTLADDLLETLVTRGVDHRIAFVVLSAAQLVPRLGDRAGAILDAQQARGLAVTGSLGRRVRTLVPLVGPLLLGSLVDVRERTFALEARGFGARSTRTAYRTVSDPPIDRWLRLGLAVACLAIVVVALAGDAPMSAAPSLVVERLTVTYAGRAEPALADVSLGVAPGELVTVAGRTGAGKSTLALACAGFIPRVVRARISGAARLGGVELTTSTAKASDAAGRVGVVFSTPANQLSASKLTVREELAFGLENLAVPRAEMDARIDAVLERLDIAHLGEREPFSLSGGEQQRVAIASILVMGAATLVLDEPAAHLDPAAGRALADILTSEAADGRTILCAEHDPIVLGRSARCLVLDGGRGIALAEPGFALSDAVLMPVGQRAPTLVRLAERAGLAGASAFDEPAVAAGLRTAGLRDGSPGPAPAAMASETELSELGPVGIRLRGIRFRYPAGVDAIRGVDLEIAPGETLAIVGQNGSGKTTLAKHFVGLLRPTAGSVEIGGRDIAARPVHEVARTVGFAFQDPADQLFERTVEREIAFGPRNMGFAGEALAGRVDRAIALAGLETVRAENPFDLGPSVRKLVALASVVAWDPAVLVLDEPTSGQDGPGKDRVAAIVEAHRRAGRTVVAITHDMEFAAASFERLVVMRSGTIAADGPPASIFGPGRSELLASTGLEPPVAARIGALLGLGSTPTEAQLLEALLRDRGPAEG